MLSKLQKALANLEEVRNALINEFSALAKSNKDTTQVVLKISAINTIIEQTKELIVSVDSVEEIAPKVSETPYLASTKGEEKLVGDKNADFLFDNKPLSIEEDEEDLEEQAIKSWLKEQGIDIDTVDEDDDCDCPNCSIYFDGESIIIGENVEDEKIMEFLNEFFPEENPNDLFKKIDVERKSQAKANQEKEIPNPFEQFAKGGFGDIFGQGNAKQPEINEDTILDILGVPNDKRDEIKQMAENLKKFFPKQ